MDQFAHYPSLAGKAVVITGGASGIGASMVRHFVAQGCRVGFLDLDARASEALMAELITEDLPAYAISYRVCDLRNIDEMKAALASLAEEQGHARILVNNAANDDRHGWRDVTPDYFDDRMHVNLRHFYFAIQAAAPGMIAETGGSIINVSSYSWVEGAPDLSVYIAANAAIHGLTRSFAKDLGKHHIRVNTIVPGWIMTERQKEIWASEEKLAAYLERQCLPELVDPVHVASMALFLASEDARMITGGDFYVNGGVLGV